MVLIHVVHFQRCVESMPMQTEAVLVDCGSPTPTAYVKTMWHSFKKNWNISCLVLCSASLSVRTGRFKDCIICSVQCWKRQLWCALMLYWSLSSCCCWEVYVFLPPTQTHSYLYTYTHTLLDGQAVSVDGRPQPHVTSINKCIECKTVH